MKRFYILVLVALFVGATVSAQEVIKKEAEKESTEARLEKLEKHAAKQEKLRQYFNVSGFIQGMYEWHDADAAQTTDISSFSVRRARLTLAGDLYKGKAGKLDYKFYFDIARVPKNPILDMWIKYQPCKEFGIQFGQYKNPVTFEASISPSKYDFIDFSYAVQNLAKMGKNDVAGLDVTARDIGFQFLGGFIHRDGYSIINYNIGVLNGSGINTKDDNKSKDIYGKLTIKTSKDFALAAYYQWGEANLYNNFKDNDKYKNEVDGERVFDPDLLAADYRWNGNFEYVPMHRWGIGFNYDSPKVFARGEYLGGFTGNLPSEGVYAEAGYRFHLPKNAGMLWAGGMVDYFCRNCFDYIERDTKNAAIDMRYSICVGYTPIKYLRMQLAYSLEHRINSDFGNGRQFGNGIKFLVTALF